MAWNDDTAPVAAGDKSGMENVVDAAFGNSGEKKGGHHLPRLHRMTIVKAQNGGATVTHSHIGPKSPPKKGSGGHGDSPSSSSYQEPGVGKHEEQVSNGDFLLSDSDPAMKHVHALHQHIMGIINGKSSGGEVD